MPNAFHPETGTLLAPLRECSSERRRALIPRRVIVGVQLTGLVKAASLPREILVKTKKGVSLAKPSSSVHASIRAANCTGLRTDSATYADSIESFEKMVESSRMDFAWTVVRKSAVCVVGDALSLS